MSFSHLELQSNRGIGVRKVVVVQHQAAYNNDKVCLSYYQQPLTRCYGSYLKFLDGVATARMAGQESMGWNGRHVSGLDRARAALVHIIGRDI
jgi:hypothetical protein